VQDGIDTAHQYWLINCKPSKMLFCTTVQQQTYSID